MHLDFRILLVVWPALLKGTLVTIELTLVVLAAATPGGIVVALLRDSPLAWLRGAMAVVSWALRGVPPLLVLFLVFFGLPLVGPRLSPFVSAAIAMTIYMTFYFGEVFRAGLASVPQGQWRAAEALGLSPARTLFRIVVPQMIPASLPPYISHATDLMKGTALAAAVAVPELTNAAKQVFAVTYRPFEILIAAAAIYAVLDSGLIALQLSGERWATRRRRGTLSMNFSLLADYAPSLLQGFQTTVLLSAAILLIATPLALTLALMRESRIVALALPAAIYVNTFRLLPALLVLFFVFYALPQLGLRLSPLTAAIAGLSGVSAAYLSEDLRGSIAAVDPGQYRAAKALGLGYGHTIRRIVLPQALPLAIAPYMTRAILIVKSTAMASLVAVSDLTGAAVRATSITYEPFVFMLTAGAFYLGLSGLLALLQLWAEAKLRARGRSAPLAAVPTGSVA